MFWTSTPNAPSSFKEYSEAFSRALRPAIVQPLVDSHRPDEKGNAGPYVGTVGVFNFPTAIVPLIGAWSPNYMGTTPLSIQPVIQSRDPWHDNG